MIKTIFSNKACSCWFVNTSAYRSLKSFASNKILKGNFFATPGFVAENATFHIWYVFFLASFIFTRERTRHCRNCITHDHFKQMMLSRFLFFQNVQQNLLNFININMGTLTTHCVLYLLWSCAREGWCRLGKSSARHWWPVSGP